MISTGTHQHISTSGKTVKSLTVYFEQHNKLLCCYSNIGYCKSVTILKTVVYQY